MIVSTLADLHSRLAYARDSASRGLAFCVGSGITMPEVPGVAAAIDLMAKAVGVDEEDDFRRAVGATRGGAAYQSAASFVLARRGQSFLNAIVRELVLTAHRPTREALNSGELTSTEIDDAYCPRAEADLDGWDIPEAVLMLARLVVRARDLAPGPILTTNFDPLVELAIRREGGTAVSLNLDADGRIGDVESVGGVLVVHLHGYWRLGDTLHAPVQLIRRREILQASLEELFENRTVLVCGYGGWDDAFTGSLAEAVRRHRHGELDVLWTFHESDEATLSYKHRGLDESVGFVPGRVSFYAGVDAEALFRHLTEFGSDGWGVDPSAMDFRSPIEGFAAISEYSLRAQPRLETPDRLVPFFDGQVPTWLHALSPIVPKLSATRRVIAAIEEDLQNPTLRVHLLQGPAGEGKSTLALQVAAHFGSESHPWRVLWKEPGFEASVPPLTDLATGDWRWLLVLDDADVYAKALFDALVGAHEAGRTDLTVLLMCRDTDWIASNAPKWPWSEYVELVRHEMRGLTERDAEEVVEAWASAGHAGLGGLASEPDSLTRARLLHEATVRESSDPSRTHEGSFLGGMLRVRFGEGLQDHVRDLMSRLVSRQSSSGVNSLNAFLTIAAPHSENILTLSGAVLAETLRLAPSRVFSEVVWPLGDEAAATRAGAAIITRHRAIAEAAVGIAASFGEDVAEIYYEIIRATIRVRRSQVFVADMATFLYLGSRLIEADPRIAVRAAQAPVDEEPNRITYRNHLVRILRLARRAEEGLEIAAQAYSERTAMFDRRSAYRGLLFEWGVACGVTRRPAHNAVLAAQSMSDLGGADPVDADGARVGLRGLALAFAALARDHDLEVFRCASDAARFLEGVLGSKHGDAEAALERIVVGARLAETHLADEPPPGGSYHVETWRFDGLRGLLSLDLDQVPKHAYP